MCLNAARTGGRVSRPHPAPKNRRARQFRRAFFLSLDGCGRRFRYRNLVLDGCGRRGEFRSQVLDGFRRRFRYRRLVLDGRGRWIHQEKGIQPGSEFIVGSLGEIGRSRGNHPKLGRDGFEIGNFQEGHPRFLAGVEDPGADGVQFRVAGGIGGALGHRSIFVHGFDEARREIRRFLNLAVVQVH